jgi:hypothetical protein
MLIQVKNNSIWYISASAVINKTGHQKMAHFWRDWQPGWKKYRTMSLVISSYCELFIVYHHQCFIRAHVFVPNKLNPIVLKIEKSQSSQSAFDSIGCEQERSFKKNIQFDFDSIWQPWAEQFTIRCNSESSQAHITYNYGVLVEGKQNVKWDSAQYCFGLAHIRNYIAGLLASECWLQTQWYTKFLRVWSGLRRQFFAETCWTDVFHYNVCLLNCVGSNEQKGQYGSVISLSTDLH